MGECASCVIVENGDICTLTVQALNPQAVWALEYSGLRKERRNREQKKKGKKERQVSDSRST